MVLYYGSYSPGFIGMSRGKRKKKNQDELIPYIPEPEKSSKARPPRPETGTGSGGATHIPIYI